MMNFGKKIIFILMLVGTIRMDGKTLIWDLDGVLFHTSRLGIAHSIGFSHFFKYIFWDWKSPFIEPLIFNVLESFSRHKSVNNNYIAHGHNQRPLPAIMHDWLIGKKQGSHILQELVPYVDSPQARHLFSSTRQKELIKSAIISIFDPCILNHNTYILKSGLQLLKDCAHMRKDDKQVHQLIALSNRDVESFELLKATYPEVFTLFAQTHIIISAHIGLAKPDPAIYQYVLNKFNLNPADCIFLDDQLVNIKSAQQLGIPSIRVNNNFKNIRRQFKKLNILF